MVPLSILGRVILIQARCERDVTWVNEAAGSRKISSYRGTFGHVIGIAVSIAFDSASSKKSRVHVLRRGAAAER
jgi:hypothetical protein